MKLYDVINDYRSYQIEWLTSHCDIKLEPHIENLVIRFLQDTAISFVPQAREEYGDNVEDET